MFEYLGSNVPSTRPTKVGARRVRRFLAEQALRRIKLVSVKTGKIIEMRTVDEAAPADTRQGRRARERFSKKWRPING